MESTTVGALVESTKIILRDKNGRRWTLQVDMKVLERVSPHEDGHHQSSASEQDDDRDDGQTACLTRVRWMERPKVIAFHPSLANKI